VICRRGPRALGAALLVATVLASLLVPAAGAMAVTKRASLTQIESEVMCVACHELLEVAQSPEAYSERQYVNDLIAKGETRKQIEANLVAQYGVAVLALPPASGFNLTVYVLPPAVVLIGLATLAYFLPRWRRRSRLAAAMQSAAPAALAADDAARLDADLARNS
jgi:cytochrome c-type biogenesis protein CcmH